MCLTGYALPCYVSLGGVVSEAILPKRGIVAGCVIATALVILHYARAFCAFAAARPSVALTVYAWFQLYRPEVDVDLFVSVVSY